MKEANAVTEETYHFEFDQENLRSKEEALNRKIRGYERQQRLAKQNRQTFNTDHLKRLQKRTQDLEKAWSVGSFVIMKCGSDIRFVKRGRALLMKSEPQSLNLDLGPDVWLHSIV